MTHYYVETRAKMKVHSEGTQVPKLTQLKQTQPWRKIQNKAKTNIKFLDIASNLQKTVDRFNEPLVMMVTHCFNLFVVSFYASVQAIQKLLWLWAIINWPKEAKFFKCKTVSLFKLQKASLFLFPKRGL